jgi:hypothetical protein
MTDETKVTKPRKSGGKRVGKDEIERARKKLEEYKAAKAGINEEIKLNEQWYRRRHMMYLRSGKKVGNHDFEGDSAPPERVMGEDVEPVTAYVFNSVQNFHADAMDNYPRANVLARSPDDEEEAYKIKLILPALHQRIGLERVYDRVMWCKGIQGWGVYTVCWDKDKAGGRGDLAVKKVKLLNLYWDIEVEDIQDSSDVFYVHRRNAEDVKRMYPKVNERDITTEEIDYQRHTENPINATKDKVDVVDWYYKKRGEDGRVALHFCQFVGEQILYATENEAELSERGLYDHGKYPFVFDVLYPLEGMAIGFGKVSVGANTQAFIDILNKAVMEKALWSCRPRYFEKEGVGLNEADFLDTNKRIVKVSGDLENIKPMELPGVDGNVIAIHDRLVETVNANTNTRDVATGSAPGGVTAASGLAILDQNQGKTGRDANRESFRAFEELVTMEIELMRQFYTEDHYFRVMDERTGQTAYVAMNNKGLTDKSGDPVEFDLELTTEKNSEYTRMSHNELILSFFNAGFFDPNRAATAIACLSLMDFESKQELIEMLKQNQAEQEQKEAVAQLIMSYAQAIDEMNAADGVESNVAQQAQMIVAQYLGTENTAQAGAAMPNLNKESSGVTSAREGAAQAASPT